VQEYLPDTKAFKAALHGKNVDLIILQNKNLQIAITNYGARIVSLLFKDKSNVWRDVIVGFDSLEGYLNSTEPYHGAIIGRYANRIKNGKFTLHNKEYILDCNNGPNHLHGGHNGFHNVVWEIEKLNESTVLLSYLSNDGEESYPGNLNTLVKYSLNDINELHILYEAKCDKETIINITNHSYFNLNGQGNGTILNHKLFINADNFTPIDNTSIPLGSFEPTFNTPFDFTREKMIGEEINSNHEQLLNGTGYDHNFVLNKSHNNELSLAARATGNESGIILEILTTQPGIQLYTGNFMKGENQIKLNKRDSYRTAFCLETQHFPDSPNKPSFPSTVINPEQTFRSETIFRFFTNN
jgi:aldose 1-epimerase